MAIKNGKRGQVNGIGCVRTWQTNREAGVQTYAASCTNGGTAASKGNLNETGSISGYGSPPAAVFPGTESTLALMVDTAQSLDGTVLFTSLTVEVPKTADTPVVWSAEFGVQGVLSEGTTAIAADTFDGRHDGAGSAANPLLGAVALGAMQSQTFTITTPETTYVDNGVIKRTAGNVECTASVEVFDDAPLATGKTANTIDTLKMYINATEFWEFNWMMLTGYSNFLVDRESAAIIGYTLNFQWSSRKATGDGLGHILLPDASTYLFGAA